jgi:hypothetical protein
MKTQVIKNSETVKSSNFKMFVSMIVFGGLLLFAATNKPSLFGNSSLNVQSKPDYFNNKTIKNPAPESDFSMAKMQAYLIPEIEPELNVSFANSIVFPDAETVVLTADNALSNDYFLKDLQIQASEKTSEAVEYYAFKKKIKEYLSIETEMPLELEDWMMDEIYWNYKLNKARVLTEENNDITIK